MQICYTDMLPFEDIPDDTVPVTAYLKVMYELMDGIISGWYNMISFPRNC